MNQNEAPLTTTKLTPQQLEQLYLIQDNDEISIKELAIAIWTGKWLIFLFMFALTSIAVVYANMQPNVYQANMSFMIEPDPYGIANNQGNNVADYLGAQSNLVHPIVTSDSFIDKYEEVTGEKGSYPAVRRGGAGILRAFVKGGNPKLAFEQLELFSENINALYKSVELDSVSTQVDALEQLVVTYSNDELNKRYANELLKKQLLLNDDFALIKIISQPSQPQKPIQPNRARIVVIGALLGFILGMALVVLRYAFRQDD